MMSGANDRASWLDALCRIADPVLIALSERRLRQSMPVEARTSANAAYTHLEALGRTLAGIAPWLETPSSDPREETMRHRRAVLARAAIDAATDPGSPDFLNFGNGQQPIVDAAFLAHAILRAPNELWEKLDAGAQANLVAALRATREERKPAFNNWLLFSAIIEAALQRMGESWDRMRVDFALRQHEQWYVGDGVYGDGPAFHWDYYNSFVIQPMLIDILIQLGDFYSEWERMREPVIERATRYAAVLERMISPEGTYPIIGRSIAYRFGAFQLLGQIALMHKLPGNVRPAQVRCAMTAVIERTLSAKGTFDENGWLKIGVIGSQPGLGERYISTGSLYLCTTGLLPLGLPPEDPFWSDPPEPWTSLRVFNGEDIDADHAIDR